MSVTTEFCERLRDPEYVKRWFDQIGNEAADAIERLERELSEVTERHAEAFRLALHHQSRAEAAERELEALRGKLEELGAPEIHDFVAGAEREAAHQRERWGADHDEGKSAEDWLWLVAYLATKAGQASRYGDQDKYLHHIITCAAACCNWHAFASGSHTAMRPGQSKTSQSAALTPPEK